MMPMSASKLGCVVLFTALIAGCGGNAHKGSTDSTKAGSAGATERGVAGSMNATGGSAGGSEVAGWTGAQGGLTGANGGSEDGGTPSMAGLPGSGAGGEATGGNGGTAGGGGNSGRSSGGSGVSGATGGIEGEGGGAGEGGVSGGGLGGASSCSDAPVDCPATPTSADFTCYEELGYCRFLVDSYPSGLRDPSWGGVYSTLTPGLACGEEVCADHRVCSESTSLLALLAALRGDETTYDQMLQIWFDPKKHYSAENHLAHWVLDSNGAKLPEPIPSGEGSGFLNASGEEVRMLLALVRGGDTFDSFSDSPSRLRAEELGTSMKERLSGAETDPAPYLLRPWWAWSTDADELHLPGSPDRASLNIIIPLAYHAASTASWLPQELQGHFKQILAPTLSTITGCAEGQMFHPQYILAASTCADEDSTPDGCQVLACADIAARLADYASAAGLEPSAQAKSYLDFLEGKYREDGVLWNAYSYLDGQPMSATGAPFASLVDYVFLAKLAVAFGRWDLAEKIFMEQVIPNQVFPSNEHPSSVEGEYLGAFRPRLAEVSSCWNDAQAFPNLETVTALHVWNVSTKNGWTSSYPRWVTIPPSPRTSTGGTDTVEFDEVETRYVRLLLKKRGTSWDNCSLYEIEASGGEGPLEITSASASSVQWDTGTPPGRAWTTNFVFDGDADTRWSSSQDNSDPQWIYIDFGAERRVSKLLIHWENAYAAEYEVQRAEID
jgi:hypothetical protein